MAKKSPPYPTDSELAILSVLWDRGPSTVRDVFEALGKQGGYTTVLKLMQIMAEKGLVERDESRRTHVYKAKLAQEQTQRQIVRDVLDRAFGGSAQKLVMHALSAKRTSPEELAQIKALIESMEGEAK